MQRITLFTLHIMIYKLHCYNFFDNDKVYYLYKYYVSIHCNALFIGCLKHVFQNIPVFIYNPLRFDLAFHRILRQESSEKFRIVGNIMFSHSYMICIDPRPILPPTGGAELVSEC